MINQNKKPPALGGLFFIIYLSIIYYFKLDEPNLNNYLFFGFLIILLGMYDDIFDMNPFLKFFFQFLIITPFCLIEYNTIINHNILFLMLIITNYIIFINSSNIIDGIDGLLGIITISSLSLILFNLENFSTEVFLLLIFVIIITWMNLNPSRMYFGDSGAFFIGFSVLFFCFSFDSSKPIISIYKTLFYFSVPIIDFIYAIVRRSMNGKNIFIKDNLHIHHKLMIRNKSHIKTISLLLIINFVMALISKFI